MVAPSFKDARFIFLFLNLIFSLSIDPKTLNLATPPSGKIFSLMCEIVDLDFRGSDFYENNRLQY